MKSLSCCHQQSEHLNTPACIIGLYINPFTTVHIYMYIYIMHVNYDKSMTYICHGRRERVKGAGGF